MPLSSSVSVIKPGTINHFAASTAPAGWLKANGAAVSRSLYAGLFSAIGTTYGAGDGSTTFTLPDLRGEFIRGWDDARGVDSGRVLGSGQAEANKAAKNPASKYYFAGVGYEAGVAPDFGFGDNTASDTETRPRNVALLACIKY